MELTRRARLALTAAAIVAVVVAIVVAVLPEVVRYVAVKQLRELTKRDVALDDVDLNVFTGRVTLKGFRLAHKDRRESALSLERLDVGLSAGSLIFKHARITEIRLVGPRIAVTRLGPAQFDFSDLLDLIPPPDPNAPKSNWIVTVERLVLERGTILARDRVTTPASEWRIDNLAIDGGDITTRPGARSGRLELKTVVNGARVLVNASGIALTPVAATVAVRLDDFALPLVTPYVPVTVLAVPKAGTARIALTVKLAPPKDDVLQATVSGDVGVSGLEVVRRDAARPFFTLGGLALRVARADLASREVVVGDLALDRLTLDAARTRDGTIDLAALTAPPKPAPTGPAATPPVPGESPTAKPFVIVLESFSLANSSVRFQDDAVTPRAEWRLTRLSASAEKVSTGAGDPAGRYTVDGAINGATLSVKDGTVRIEPLAIGGRIALAGVDLTWARPYLPADLPVAPPTGRFGATLAFDVSPMPTLAGTISGDVQIDGLGVTHTTGAPLATLKRTKVSIASANLATRAFRIRALDLDALDVSALRAPDGAIDLVTAFTGPAGPAPPSPPAASAATTRAPPARGAASPAAPSGPPARSAPPPAASAPPAMTLQIDSVAMRRTSVTLTDRAVTPTTVLPITDWSLTLRDFTWPNTRSSRVETALTLPGGGQFTLKGSARVTPFEADVETSIRDGTPEPFGAYFPFKARFEARFNGDNRAQIRTTSAGITARAVGSDAATNIVIRDPDAPPGATPPFRMERMALDGIDFSWPTGARVAKVTMTKPDVRATRTADGIDLAGLFAFRPVAPAADKPAVPAPPSVTPAPPTQPAGAPAGATQGADGPPFALDIDAFVLEDGFARFLDQTTQPAFSESISSLRVTVDGISNTPGRRAKLAVTASLGAGATLQTRGQIAPLGDLYADTVTEVKDYALPNVNPYMSQAIAWIVQTGTLSLTTHTKVEEGTLDLRNALDVRRLDVAKAPGHDTAEKKLGLPLDMIVALITDRDNGFKTDIPVAGKLNDPQFAWGDAIWTAVKNVLVNVAAGPFRAIGRMMVGKDNTIDKMEVEPVTFASGTAALGPDTERHLLRVADFLRAAPRISLEVAPVVTRADAEELRAQVLRSRVTKRQTEKALPGWAAAVKAEYAVRFPKTPVPKTTDEQLARLTAAEPIPEAAVADLRARRVQTVLEALTKTDGVEAARLRLRDGAAVADEAEPGRVEFHLAH